MFLYTFLLSYMCTLQYLLHNVMSSKVFSSVTMQHLCMSKTNEYHLPYEFCMELQYCDNTHAQHPSRLNTDGINTKVGTYLKFSLDLLLKRLISD